jgi:hypothetical protein
MAAENGSPPEGKKTPNIPEREAKPGATVDIEGTTASPQTPRTESVEASPAGTGAAIPADTASDERGPGADESDRDGPDSDGPGAAPPAVSTEALAAERSHPTTTMLILAGVVGGLIVLIAGFGLQAIGLVPTPGRSAAEQALAEAGKASATLVGLDQRTTALEASSSQAIADRALLDDLSKKVDSIEAASKSLGDRLLNAETEITTLKDDLTGPGGVSAKQMLSSLSNRVMRLETQPPPANDGGIDEKTQQALDVLSERVARLATPPQSGHNEDAAAPATGTEAASAPPEASAPSNTAPTPTPVAPLAATAPATPPTVDDRAASEAALEAFRQAASAGGPFADALRGIGSLGSPTTIAALEPLAEKGAPSRPEIVAAFPGVADRILAAGSAGDENAGFFGRVAAFGRSLVKVRPVDAPAGDATAAIVEKMRTAVAGGDVEAALAERDGLPAAGLSASQAWADAAADRLAIDRLAAEIAAPGGTDGGNG